MTVAPGSTIELPLFTVLSPGQPTPVVADPVTIDIRDNNYALIVSGAAVTTVAVGVYEYAYTVPPAASGFWWAVWSGVIGGDPATVTEQFAVVAAVAVRGEVSR